MITVVPLSNAIGAEVLGVDLSRPVPAQLAYQLNQALLEHIVLVVRGQQLTPGEYVKAMSAFGVPAKQNHVDELLPGHPEIWVIDSREANLRPDGSPILFGAYSWHTDHTNLVRPPKVTALYAVALPSKGGDTCFANAYQMFERVPAERRDNLRALRAVNGADRHLPRKDSEAEAFATPAIHPLVRKHPETGREALYVHPLKLQHFEGMDRDESYAFATDLIESCLDSELIYRHEWQPGDLVLIDNRACLHRAMQDYDHTEGRVMHRVIIEGDIPA